MFLKLLPYIGIIAFAVGLFFAGQMRGSLQCQLSIAKQDTVAIAKEVKTNEKIENRVKALSDDAVTTQLRAHWMRH